MKTIRGQTSKCTIHSHLCILDASTHIRIELLSNKVLSRSKLLQKMLMKLFGNILMLKRPEDLWIIHSQPAFPKSHKEGNSCWITILKITASDSNVDSEWESFSSIIMYMCKKSGLIPPKLMDTMPYTSWEFLINSDLHKNYFELNLITGISSKMSLEL